MLLKQFFQKNWEENLQLWNVWEKKSDYDDFYFASREQAQTQLETAELIVESIIEYLNAQK